MCPTHARPFTVLCPVRPPHNRQRDHRATNLDKGRQLPCHFSPFEAKKMDYRQGNNTQLPGLKADTKYTSHVVCILIYTTIVQWYLNSQAYKFIKFMPQYLQTYVLHAIYIYIYMCNTAFELSHTPSFPFFFMLFMVRAW